MRRAQQFKHVKILKRGVKRADGKGRACMWQACGRPATVMAMRTYPKLLTVVYCEEHAQTRGILKS